jgi:hypothetical protein
VHTFLFGVFKQFYPILFLGVAVVVNIVVSSLKANLQIHIIGIRLIFKFLAPNHLAGVVGKCVGQTQQNQLIGDLLFLGEGVT